MTATASHTKTHRKTSINHSDMVAKIEAQYVHSHRIAWLRDMRGSDKVNIYLLTLTSHFLAHIRPHVNVGLGDSLNKKI